MHEFSMDRSWLDEVVREAVKQALETVMELEREVFLAEWGGKKNGYYERGLVTKHGPVRLRVPRERDGRFHTALFAPYQRRMEDFALAMYAAGISARKVGEVLGYLLGETYSASTIGRLSPEGASIPSQRKCYPGGRPSGSALLSRATPSSTWTPCSSRCSRKTKV